jgi:predicted nucleic acid-binding protein
MEREEVDPGGSQSRFVWDASVLYHAWKADRSDALHDLAGTLNRHFVSSVVARELARLGARAPDWTILRDLDDLETLQAIVQWQTRLGGKTGDEKDLGEAATLAVAQVDPGTIAVIDDQDARRVALRYGASVHGSLWVIGQAINEGRWDRTSVSSWCDVILDTGIRWPFERGGFTRWAEDHDVIRRVERGQR